MANKNNKKEIKYVINENGCHICISHSTNTGGYIKIMRNKKLIYIHRMIYEEKFGDLQKGIIVRHKCDNRNCINLDHLEHGTHQDNMNDMVQRGRSLKGEKNRNSKLKDNDILDIKNLLKEGKLTQSEIASFYGIYQSSISNIKLGKNHI